MDIFNRLIDIPYLILQLNSSDLPLCRASGIGASTNEIFRRDGRRADMHPLEDRSFRFSVDEFGISVYGVFDGFGGSQVINEISQRASNNQKKNIIN